MNKLILSLLLSVFCIVAQAQIQRKILGSQLGVSTEAQVKDVMSQKGYEVSLSDKDSFSYNDVMFAGNKCNLATYRFFKEKLCVVTFVISMSKLREMPQNTFNSLKLSLDRKYKDYKKEEKHSECTYMDGNTQVFLSILETDYGYAVGLSYVDDNLFGQRFDEGLDEL